MRGSRAWMLAGLVAGVAGLATSYFAAMLLTAHAAPVSAIASLITKLTPGPVVERAIGLLGHHDKTFLVTVIVVASVALFAWAGVLARRSWWAPTLVFAGMAVLGAVAVLSGAGATGVDVLPVAVGFATWVVCLGLLTDPLRRTPSSEPAAEPADPDEPDRPVPVARPASRREFLIRAGVVVAGAAVIGTVGRVVGNGRRQVEAARRLLRLPGVTEPRTPAGVGLGVPGITPWVTSPADFYRIDTAFVVPTIEPSQWRLRIHGMVDHEIELTYQDLVDRRITEAWVTLNCVSNPVGGDLIGNAWWSGVRLADLLAEAGVQQGADAVLQTSDDGWTCGTPLSALTDGRDAMLAVAMNGQPLPIDHGFPVRTLVPGLYGYVSACKWVVDMEVTKFSDFSAYWTERGWSEMGPVKIASRIDVPSDGGKLSAKGRVGGMAWAQHTGISAVEVQVDGGAWQRTQLGRVPNDDTWVQWAATIDVAPGHHRLAVRAVDADGHPQTGAVQDVVPNGATGWDTISFEAT